MWCYAQRCPIKKLSKIFGLEDLNCCHCIPMKFLNGAHTFDCNWLSVNECVYPSLQNQSPNRTGLGKFISLYLAIDQSKTNYICNLGLTFYTSAEFNSILVTVPSWCNNLCFFHQVLSPSPLSFWLVPWSAIPVHSHLWCIGISFLQHDLGLCLPRQYKGDWRLPTS